MPGHLYFNQLYQLFSLKKDKHKNKNINAVTVLIPASKPRVLVDDFPSIFPFLVRHLYLLPGEADTRK